MKQPPHKAPRGLLTLKALSPLVRAGVKERGRKSRKSISLEGALFAPTEDLEQHDTRDAETYQSAAGTRVGSAADAWGGAKEALILQPKADGKGLKKTLLRLHLKPPRIKIPGKPGPKPRPLTYEEKEQIETQQSRQRKRKRDARVRAAGAKIS